MELSRDDVIALKAYAAVQRWPALYFLDRPHPHRKLHESGLLSVKDDEEFGKVASITSAGRAALSHS